MYKNLILFLRKRLGTQRNAGLPKTDVQRQPKTTIMKPLFAFIYIYIYIQTLPIQRATLLFGCRHYAVGAHVKAVLWPARLRMPFQSTLQAVHSCTKAPAKRSQHANATYRNIIGRNMLRSFGHRVTTCWVLLAQV